MQQDPIFLLLVVTLGAPPARRVVERRQQHFRVAKLGDWGCSVDCHRNAKRTNKTEKGHNCLILPLGKMKRSTWGNGGDEKSFANTT